MDATPGNPLGDSSSAMTEQAAVARPDAVTNEGAASFSTGHAFHEGGIRERISIDPNSDDESVIGSFTDIASTTYTKANMFEFVTEADGRRYHRYRQGKYPLPNDEVEQNRLNMQHNLWRMTLDNKLSLAPLKREPQHVLDLGTGTGIWAIDYALEHPKAAVIGTDLSPIQPDLIPLNCSFEVQDFEDTWLYTQKFDLIHGRLINSGVSKPHHVFAQAFSALSPGGYFEMQDIGCPAQDVDGSLRGTNLEKWYNHVIEGAMNLGLDFCGVKTYKKRMEEAGFINVEEKGFVWPINTWPKDPHLKKLGFWWNHDLLDLVEGLKPPLTRGLRWTLEDVQKLVVEVKKDVNNRNIHAYNVIRVLYGMKPEEA